MKGGSGGGGEGGGDKRRDLPVLFSSGVASLNSMWLANLLENRLEADKLCVCNS